jgi:hypothetical protein
MGLDSAASGLAGDALTNPVLSAFLSFIVRHCSCSIVLSVLLLSCMSAYGGGGGLGGDAGVAFTKNQKGGTLPRKKG